MTLTRAFVKFTSLSAAVFAHGAVAMVLVSQLAIEMEEAQGGAEVALGSSFADMAAGTLSAATPPDTMVEPEDHAEPLEVERPEVDAAEQPEPLKTEQPQTLAAEPAKPLAAVQGTVPIQPVSRATVAAEPPETTIKAEPEKEAPKPKPKPAPEKEKPKVEKKAPPKPKGNAEANARAGDASGKTEAKAAARGNQGASKQSGNAAASNYPGKVMQKLSRVPRPRVRSKGAAVVTFTLSASGGLASATITKSSGSKELDRAALTVVKRASPFPAPPAGALRQFSVSISGK
ncbi:TonB family protein [Celeribacter sp.]|uniref:energy transducer TonB family protein n=1 Tax=Celeribacter sp. TaxID=1890673 RepID=UPI003A91A0BF